MMSSHARRAVAALLFLTLAAPTAASAQDAPAAPAGPSEQDLNAARQLFQEAYADEQAGRFGEALEKFLKVAKVKESAAVRYRIGACLEGLKRLREARDTYRALAANHDLATPQEREIAQSASQKVVELDRRIPRLVVRVAPDAPPGVQVRVDGAPTPSAGAVEADPGPHVVQATAEGAAPFEKRVELAEAREETVEISFASTSPPPPPPPGARRPFMGWVLVGVGGALIVAGGVTLAVREGNVSDLKSACPGGVCPASRRSELESTRDAAEMQGPLAGAFFAAGVIAGAVGAYMLIRPPAQKAAHTATAPLWLGAAPVRGGTMVSGGVSF